MKIIVLFCLIWLSVTAIGQTPGNTLSFDGTDDQVNASVPSLFDDLTTNDFTIEAWVYPTAAVFSRVIFIQSSTSNFASVSTGGTNTIFFYVVAGGNTYSLATTAEIPLNAWTHVAARWTASTLTPEVYFDGVLQAGATGGSSSTGTTGMSIGAKPGGSQYFSGQVDEIRIWKIARTACEISMNYQSTLNPADTNLVCYYDFNQGVPGGTNSTTTTLPDLCGLFNGALSGFGLSGATSNWVTSTANINNIGSGLGFTTSADTVTICAGSSYTFADGYTENIITASMNHTSTLQSISLCDSIIYTTVNVITVDTAVVHSGVVFVATGSGTYQWLDCNNDYAELTGETNQFFNASVNGSYAVEVSSNGCIDTSYCFEINNIGIDENSFGPAFTVYPNPGDGHFTVDLGADYAAIFVTVSDISGKEIKSLEFSQSHLLQIDIEEPAGTYFIHVVTAEKEAVVRLIKN